MLLTLYDYFDDRPGVDPFWVWRTLELDVATFIARQAPWHASESLGGLGM